MVLPSILFCFRKCNIAIPPEISAKTEAVSIKVSSFLNCSSCEILGVEEKNDVFEGKFSLKMIFGIKK